MTPVTNSYNGIKATFQVTNPVNHENRQKGKNQALVRAMPFCGEYPGPRCEDKFRSANQMDGISIAGGGKMADN